MYGVHNSITYCVRVRVRVPVPVPVRVRACVRACVFVRTCVCVCVCVCDYVTMSLCHSNHVAVRVLEDLADSVYVLS